MQSMYRGSPATRSDRGLVLSRATHPEMLQSAAVPIAAKPQMYSTPVIWSACC